MKMWIRLKIAVGTHKIGDLIQVDKSVGDVYVAQGLAEEAAEAAEDALKNLGLEGFRQSLKGFTDAMGEEIAAATANIKKSAGERIDPVNSAADKSKSVSDFMSNVVKAADIRDLAGLQAAQERLQKVYGAGHKVEKGMNESTGTDGGYWTMPSDFSAAIMAEAAEDAVIAPGATKVPLGNKSVEFPVLDQYQVPTKGNSAMYAGVKVSRKGENDKRDASQPKAKKIKLEAHDLTGYTSYSRDLNEDASGSLSSMLVQLFGGAIGFRRDWEHQWGEGEGSCLGINNSKAVIRLARVTPGKIVYKDLTKAKSRLLPSSRKRAIWLAHPFLEDDLLNLKDEQGGLIYLPCGTNASQVEGNPNPRMLGFDIQFTEKAGAPGEYGDLMLVDRSHYLIGERSGMEIGLSEHFMFDTDEIAVRVKIRDDGQPRLLDQITLSDGKGTNKVSAFIGFS